MDKKIEKWLLGVVNDNSWEKYNDIHIDAISPLFKDKSSWIDGGIKCFERTKKLIKIHNLPFVVELSIPLKAKKRQGDYIINSFDQISKELDYTPPSLYVFHKDWNGLKFILDKGIRLNELSTKDNGDFYYSQQYNNDDKEVRRVIFLLNL